MSFDKSTTDEHVLDWIVESVTPLGSAYQARLRTGFDGGWIDVYENDGKRSARTRRPSMGLTRTCS